MPMDRSWRTFMSRNEKYRHEWKYLIDTAQKELICKRLFPFLELDKHARGGGYMIRSLYFDDYFHTAYEEKDAGVLERKKYRIRIYNCSDSSIKLERKKKMTFGAKWENIYERLLPEYGMESGNTIAPTTGVYDGEGNFVAEIDGLAELLAGEAVDCEYRITVKVCSPKGELDEGDITVKFDPKNFE